VEPFLVSSSIVAVLAQRLVRRLCDHCKKPHHPSMEELRGLGLGDNAMTTLRQAMARGMTIYQAHGCKECLDKGYRGRSGIYELLSVDEEIRALVSTNANAGTVRARAIENGMRTLRDDGIRKVLDGVTSIDEVARVTQEDVIELD
jgi:general secretion pathway protein E